MHLDVDRTKYHQVPAIYFILKMLQNGGGDAIDICRYICRYTVLHIQVGIHILEYAK